MKKSKLFFAGLLLLLIGLGAGYAIGTAILKIANGQVVQYSPFAWNNTTVVAPASYSVGLPMQVPQFTASSTASTTGSLATSTTYYFQIEAADGVGTTTPSNEAAITTGSTTPKIVLLWGGIPGASGYTIFIATSSGAESYFLTTTSTTYTVSSTAQFAATTTVQGSNTAYAAFLNASGTSRFTTGSVGFKGFIEQGNGTSTCYLETVSATGTLTAATTTCL